MYSTKLIRLSLLSLLASLILAGCGGAPEKVQIEAEEAVIVYKKFNHKEAAKGKMLGIEQIEPNPYLTNKPDVPSSAVTEFKKALILAQTGDNSQAEKRFEAHIKAYPSLSGAAYNLGLLKKKEGKLDEAITLFQQAIERNRYNFDARNELGLIYRSQGKFTEAEKEYLEIINLWPGYLPAYRNLGILYDLYMGQPREGLIYYKQYNAFLPGQDRQVIGWILDIERRFDIKPSVEEPKPVAEVQPAAESKQGGGE